MSINFSHVCIIYFKIYEKMSSGGLEVSLSIFHENRLLADDSHENIIPYFFTSGKDVLKFVVCCSCDWRFKG